MEDKRVKLNTALGKYQINDAMYQGSTFKQNTRWFLSGPRDIVACEICIYHVHSELNINYSIDIDVEIFYTSQIGTENVLY